jgi:hypothetical protein
VSGGTVSGGSSSPGVITTNTSTGTGAVVGAFQTHDVSCLGGCPPSGPGTVYETGSVSLSGATLSGASATGGGSSHNNMQPTSFLNVMVKL